MRKIPTLFIRDDATHELTEEVHPDAAWVLSGEGVATRKFDGTAVRVSGGSLLKRLTLRARQEPPAGFLPAQDAPDPITNELPGWVPVGEGKEDAVLRGIALMLLEDGTYELVGPKVNGNPEGFTEHRLVRHGADQLQDVPRTFEGLRLYFVANPDIEGVVWHHPDGRMAKLKGRDLGVRRVKVSA